MIGRPGNRDGIQAALHAAGLPGLQRTAWLAVDLDRLRDNLVALRALVPAGTRVDPVVKADAYGHGAVQVARSLEAAGADGFGVATFDEALELRTGGVTAPILVLYPMPPDGAREAAVSGVALTLGDETLVERTIEVVGTSALAAPLEVHLEVETGLGRGGLDPNVLPRIVDRLRLAPGIRLAGVWSHLGSAADPARSGCQGRAFEAAARFVGADAHLAASGGLLAGTAPPWHRVRPGLSIYGLVPEGLAVAGDRAAAAGALRPALSLHALPVRVAVLASGTGVSYGEQFVTARESRIATLPVGYADGYQRARSGGAEALVRGLRVPLVGTIAMDAVMADVTDVPGPPVTVDDEFVLLGQQGGDEISAVNLARLGNTISWEVLAGMSRRIARVYYADAVPVGLRTLTAERGRWVEPGRQEAPGENPPSAAGRTPPTHATRIRTHSMRRVPVAGEAMNVGRSPAPELMDDLVESVAREIQVRGLTTPAVHFLQASRPYRPLGANAMLFFDPVLRGVFGGDLPHASEIMADDDGIEQLIARLEELDEEITWDA